ncbi:MAG TPA: DUF6457 domain-containing protein [Gaiellaceae bacterium]|nr:DUF6457 domain-containing protein [Gaiellaceae bacterium]
MSEWLDEFRASLESQSGTTLELSPSEIEQLLELARNVARGTGVKLNAPLACYLLGRAQGASGRPLAELIG